MSEKRRKPRIILRYVEDYIEELLYIIATQPKPRVEVKVEEEKAESLRIRVVTTLPDGKRFESVSESPKLVLMNIPNLEQVVARPPPQNIQLTLTIEDEISTEMRLLSLAKVTFPHNPSTLTMTSVKPEAGRLLSLNLPYVLRMNFYAWFRDVNKPVSFSKQTSISTFTLKHLLRLVEIPLRFPVIAEVKASVKLPVLIVEKFLVQQIINVRLTEAIKTLQDIAQAQQLKGMGLLEFLLPEEKDKIKQFLGASGEYTGEPVIIILPENKLYLWYLFWVACREVYREVRGEYPEPVILLEKGIENWLKFHGYISGKVVVLHEEKVAEQKEWLGWLKKRLQEAFSQGLGFLILIAKDVHKARKLVESLCKPYMPRVYDLLEIPEFNMLMNRLAKILSVTFGIPYVELCRIGGLSPESKVVFIREGTFDAVISTVDRAYHDFIDELLSSNYIAHVRRDIGERESEDHLAMKTLVVKDLHERFNVKLEDIICTCEVGANVVADVYVKGKALAVECETLLGVAPAPLLKIFESVRKYVETSLKAETPVSEIWVIIRNWPATLHLGDLYWAESILRRELKQQNKDVKFLIPNIYTKTLVPLEEIIKGLVVS
ncbi:MAG: hypothetical protein NDF55_04615 [archaeon GB-1867-005]|nr:hypothetical protein [Candidatus Culexmicrobium cathedralense]